ncbi:hypothetical protein [Candidatus Nitrospira inopinata]|jgi:hypothetical protein|uniref:Uncharacterized protein n=1 Tax=Candidatus Nitrospira inopinata TaxID=1715989 RepID=A0A0S4KQE0_9BACT|nr:hypothetical protein [Candidatus Nitrospira inopinata]CUQ66659.1 exported protein of unknown function [Candidatus Nitrospira inopinata]
MRLSVSVVLAGALLMVISGVGIGQAATVGQADLNGAESDEVRGPAVPVSVEEYFGRKVAQLFNRPATLTIGEYQPIGDIVPSLVRGEYTISLFTSGFNGAPAPSAVIDGSSITVDLSSLYLSHEWRDEFRIWNVGGLATGTIDLETLEFHLNWDRVFRDKHHDTVVTFTLRGTMVPVPITDTAVFFAAGLAMLLILWRLKQTDATMHPMSTF